MGGKTSNESKAKYNAKAYDRINIAVPKGRKTELQALAEANGQSVNGFLNGLIDAATEPTGAAGGGGYEFPSSDSDSIPLSRLISQWGPDFKAALDTSGQSPEEYITQAVQERMEREAAHTI